MAQNIKKKYYDIKPLLDKNCDINLIIGQRGNGKTYGVCRYMLQQCKAKKCRFAYIRRWADDIKGYRAEQLFFPLTKEVEALWGPGFSILYYRHKYYLVNPDGQKVDIIGYCLALSETAHTKSVAFTDVKYILFDEFIQMAGESTLRDEMLKYENTLSTIIRDAQDVVIFLAANTVSKFSPYFTKYGFDINKVSQGDIVTNKFELDDNILKVALEYCEYNEEVGKATSKYTTSNMITKGQWEIPPTDDIPQCENERVKEQLLCSMLEPNTGICIGMFLRTGRWNTLELDEVTQCYYTKEHVRQFLVIRQINRRSSYFHLTDQKSLDYSTYNDLGLMYKDIEEGTGIDIDREVHMGRVFCDNMFTADYYMKCLDIYGIPRVRNLL